MKRLLNVILSVALFFSVGLCAWGCGEKEASLPLLEENIIDDKYDNYYEIFVYSFCDSDGNGTGDLRGVTSKLQYIRDMGYTGIWLMPIHPSPSYHKYDVTNYKAVQRSYGTIEDFEELLSKAHSLGIKVILDMVFNHTSSAHQWFLSAVQSAANGDTQGEYYDYYNFSDEAKTGYTEYNGSGVYYESRFVSNMPDLNLDSKNVRSEISDIMKFWLEKGVDGFRLDACTSYYTDDKEKSIAFTKWIKQEAVKYNPDAYIVGEVWTTANIIEEYYATESADSFFCFPTADSTGYINRLFNSSTPAQSYWTALEQINSMSEGGIAAPILDNHDMARIAGILLRKEERIKFAYGLLSMLGGNTFTYYGSEIGMIGSGEDPNKRIGMLWDNAQTELTNPPPGATSTQYVFDGVKEQSEDSSSILNYYKLCNNARNAFPSIMRGSTERIAYADDYVLLLKKTYGQETVTIAINFATETKTVTFAGELMQSLCVGKERVVRSDSELTMPSYSIVILK